MRTFVSKPAVFEGFQFDGSYHMAHEIVRAFPDEKFDVINDYGKTCFKLKHLNPSRGWFNIIDRSDFVVKGPLGELFIYRENLFKALFNEPKEM